MIEEKTFPILKMEEEEDTKRHETSMFGFDLSHQNNNSSNDTVISVDEKIDEQIKGLILERKIILENKTFSKSEKLKLLENTRRTIVVIKGGAIRKTENVVYSILFFSGFIIIALSVLTAFSSLPSEILLAFMGTVLGGTIATISQKIGKIE